MTNTQNSAYQNDELDLTVRFRTGSPTGDDGVEFVIIGDARKVSNDTVLKLYTGRSIDGWRKLPAEHYINA